MFRKLVMKPTRYRRFSTSDIVVSIWNDTGIFKKAPHSRRACKFIGRRRHFIYSASRQPVARLHHPQHNLQPKERHNNFRCNYSCKRFHTAGNRGTNHEASVRRHRRRGRRPTEHSTEKYELMPHLATICVR